MPVRRFRLAALLLAGLIAISTSTAGLRAQCPGAHEFKPCLIQKVYQVGDLVVPAQAENPVTSEGNVCPASNTREQWLIRTIVSTIDPESWACHGGEATIDYFPLGMTLVVNQTPEVQERVGRLLTALSEMTKNDERPASQAPIGGDPLKGGKNNGDKLCALIARYRKACEKGNLTKAKKLAFKALELDPGCFAPKNTDPSDRMETLTGQSEDLREIQNEWRNFWFKDQPSHMTYERIHGGIDDAESKRWHELFWEKVVAVAERISTTNHHPVDWHHCWTTEVVWVRGLSPTPSLWELIGGWLFQTLRPMTCDRIDDPIPGWHEVLWTKVVESVSRVETRTSDPGPTLGSGPLCGPAEKQTPREWLLSIFSGPPKHMTYDRIHGGIE